MNLMHSIDVMHTGGIGDYILNLFKYDKVNQHVVCCNRGGGLDEEAAEAGLMFVHPDNYTPDVVIGHGVGGWSENNLFTWARSVGAKTVECLHSNAKSLTDPNLTDALVGLNHIVTNLNPQFNRRETIYGIVETSKFFRHEEDVRLGKQIGKLSRMVEEKGAYHILDIARELPEYQFHVAGTGNLWDYSNQHKPSNVKLYGSIRVGQPMFYAACDLFVFPTKDEACCVSVAQAQASGVPVICQDLPALVETTGGYATFCTSNDDFVSSIVAYYANPKPFEDKAVDAYKWAREKFSPETIVAQWQNLFLTL